MTRLPESSLTCRVASNDTPAVVDAGCPDQLKWTFETGVVKVSVRVPTPVSVAVTVCVPLVLNLIVNVFWPASADVNWYWPATPGVSLNSGSVEVRETLPA